MLLLLLNYVVLRALWKIDACLISTLVNKSLFCLFDISQSSIWPSSVVDGFEVHVLL